MAGTDLSLTMISHACMKVGCGETRLLCDPWFLNEPVYNYTTWKYPPAIVPPDQVAAGLTHLFVSHSHEDHFHVPSIDRLSRDIVVLLPEYTWHPSLRAHTVERTMRALGFHAIRKIRPWETVCLGDDLRLTMVPSAASKSRDWENAGLVIEGGGVRILNMNDCPSDDALYAELRSRFAHFDVMLVQYAGVTVFPGRFRMSEAEMREAVRQKRTNYAEQERAVRLLSFDKLVPFAGDFGWFDDRLFHCNWACRALPTAFGDWVDANFPDRTWSLMTMLPSDVWSRKTGLVRNHPAIDWSKDEANMRAVKRRLQPKIDALNQWFAQSDRRDLRKRSEQYLAHVERWVGAQDIDFTVAIRFMIEGADAGFSFTTRVDPDRGVRFEWDRDDPVDQTVYLQQEFWASILAGKAMLGNLSWPGVIDQHRPFRQDFARFWFWTEFYLDLMNRSPQVFIDPIVHPEIGPRVEPGFGVFHPEW